MKREVRQYELPVTIPGTRRFVTVFAYGEAKARPRVYLQAGLHGNEHPGLLVLTHLTARLDELASQGRIKGRILVAPLVNPIGQSQFLNNELVGRFDFYGGNNFNRNFPRLAEAAAKRVQGRLTDDGSANLALLREALAAEAAGMVETDEAAGLRQIITRLAVDADVALDLHADGQSLLHIYTHVDRESDARTLGADLGVPVVLLGSDPKAGSFDDTFNLVWEDLARLFPGRPVPSGCFAAAIELRGRTDVSDELAARDAEGLIRFLTRQGAIEGDPGPLPELADTAPTPLAGVDHGRAPMGGLAVFHKKAGELVKKGELVADIVDPIAEDPKDTRVTVYAATDGLLFSVNLVRLVRAGQIFFKIAGREILKTDQDQMLED